MSFVDRDLIRAAILALGITLGGLFAGAGLARARASDRFVTVKGISEREVTADVAIWPLRLVAADNDLAQGYGSLRRSAQRVRDFLVAQQIDTADIQTQDFAVTDAFANQYGGDRITSRYAIRQTIVVRSSNPERVLAASQRINELVSAGVVLSSGGEWGNSGPTFVFTKLNDLKPPMIAEATARAREAAQQFARDADSELGGIRRANQGVFEILPRDQAPGIFEGAQMRKTVRVVTTVEYLLK